MEQSQKCTKGKSFKGMPEVKELKELKLSVGQRKGKADMAEIIYKIIKNILPCLLLLCGYADNPPL